MAHVAKGPLSSAAGQWAFVGLGTYAVAGGENLQSMAQSALRFGMQLASGTPLHLTDSRSGQTSSQQQQPIIIHSVGPGGNASWGNSLTQKPLLMLLQLTIGAGICWGSYILFSTFLPDQIKEMLPVTRKFFDAAITSLGNGILHVREALSEQIHGLSVKQDELSDKQDETHVQVLSVRNDLGEVRFDLNSISDTVARCENSLSLAERRQSYTARGVSLLVRCVGAMMPGNARLAGELERFSRAGEEFVEDDDDEVEAEQKGGQQQRKPTPARSSSAPSGLAGENPQSQTPGYRTAHTPSYVTPAHAYGGPGSISSVETDPENAGHENAEMGMGGGNANDLAPPPTPQDLDEVRMLLDMVRRGGTISVK